MQKNEVVSNFRETIKPIKPVTKVEHETSIEIPISREMLTAPLFEMAKNVQVNEAQIFYLNPQKTRSIEISPNLNDTINTEFEERVFMAMIDIGKRQQRFLSLSSLPREIFTTVSFIIKTMGLRYDGRYRERVIKALERLQHTNYKFNNCFFNAEKNNFIEIENTAILSRYHYKSFLDVEESNPAILEFFGNDKRIKDFIVVEISKPFYTNLVNKKGYLSFDSNQLLSIDNGVARKLFMYCDRNRWRDDSEYKSKGDDLKFRVLVQILAQIIPLSFTPKRVPDTVKTIERSLQYLKTHNLIMDYIFHKEYPSKNSWIEVFFEKSRKYDGEKNFNDFNIHEQETKSITNSADIHLIDKDNSKNQWNEFYNFYVEVYVNDKKLSRLNEFSSDSQCRLLEEFQLNKFYAIKLANYVVNKGKDVNAYLVGHGKDNKFYISASDADILKNKHEKKTEDVNTNNKQKIETKKKEQLAHIRKQQIQHEYHKLSPKDQEKYIKYAKQLMKKYEDKLTIFNDDFEDRLILSIYAASAGETYDSEIQLYMNGLLGVTLSIIKNS